MGQLILPSLYPHQEDLRDRTRAALCKHRSVIMSILMGGGKTRLAKWMLGSACMKPKTDASSGRFLFAVHRRGLVDNASDSFNEYPPLPHGVVMAGKESMWGMPIQVASIDTLLSWFVEGVNYSTDYTFDIVVIDEAHSHLGKFRTFLNAHNLKREELGLPEPFVIGLTATPQAKGLGDVFSEIVFGPNAQWMTDNGFIKPYRYYRATQGKLSKLIKRGDEFTESSVSDAMDGLAGDLVRDWLKYAQGRATVGFFPRRSHAYEAMELLRANGVNAEYIDGQTDDDSRRAMFKRLNDGKIDYVANVGVIERGTDIPRIGCVQLCTAIGSLARYCLDEKTEVLTPQGWIGIDDEMPSECYQVDLERRCTVGKVIDRFERPLGNDSMWGIDGTSLDIRVTENHRMLVKRRRGPVLVANSQSLPHSFSIPVNAFEDAPGVPLSDDDIRFIGLVATDGCINKANNAIKLFQSERHPECIEYIIGVLNRSKFRFGTHKIANDLPGSYKCNYQRWTYSISKGMPMKREERDAGLTGWGRLDGWVSDNPAVTLKDCTREQLLVLLEAMVVGDGLKYKSAGIYWTPRTDKIAFSKLEYAEAMQSLCVRRGIRSNLTVMSHGVPCITADSTRNWWTALKTSSDNRPVWGKLPSSPDERVWCVTVESGFIIARRNGKVFITGNCQVIGRASRPHPEVPDAIVLDHGGNIKRHGFITDEIKWSLDWTTRPAKTHKTRPSVECPQCDAIYRGGKCRNCGYEPKKKELAAQGLQFDGRELTEIKPKDSGKKAKSPEDYLISALFRAGRTGKTFGAAIFMARQAAQKDGVDFRVPKTFTVAGKKYRSIPFGDKAESSRKVQDTYPFSVGNYRELDNPYFVEPAQPAATVDHGGFLFDV